MNNKISLLLTAGTLLTTLTSAVSSASSSLRQLPINALSTPHAKSATGDILLTVHVTYINGCYKPYSTAFKFDEITNKISVSHVATQSDQICTQKFYPKALIPTNIKMNLGKLKNGRYEIYDTETKSEQNFLCQLEVTDYKIDISGDSQKCLTTQEGF